MRHPSMRLGYLWFARALVAPDVVGPERAVEVNPTFDRVHFVPGQFRSVMIGVKNMHERALGGAKTQWFGQLMSQAVRHVEVV